MPSYKPWGLILPPCWFAFPTRPPPYRGSSREFSPPPSPPFWFPPINGLSTRQLRTSCPSLLHSSQRHGVLPIVSKAIGSRRVDDIGWRLVAHAATAATDGRLRTRAMAGSRICITGVPTCRSSASHHCLCTALIGRLWFAARKS
jgi:hypothetical protein